MSPIEPLILLVITIIIFWFMLKRRDIVYPIEQNNKSLLNVVCGGCFGVIRVTIPFVRFAMYEKFIVITFVVKYIINYSDIDYVHIRSLLIATTYNIYFIRDGQRRTIVIGTFLADDEAIKEIFRKNKVRLLIGDKWDGE